MTPMSMNKAILAIALPAMLTSVATALFGMADMWVIGRLGDPPAQGAVEIGAKLLMSLLVVFNFLRSSSVALTAQAAGRGDTQAQTQILLRGLASGLIIAAVLMMLKPLAIALGLEVFSARGEVAVLAQRYVAIRYWGAAPWLLNAVLTGWLIGRRRVRPVLVVEVAANLAHILLDLSLVLGLNLGVAGVATATLTSESVKLLALTALAAREPPARGAVAAMTDPGTWRAEAIGDLLRLNRDLFGRTLLLMVATILLTRSGARQGAVVLAANAILYQLFMLSALLLDGFESAAQVLCGEALGAGRRVEFEHLIGRLLMWAWGTALLISLIYAVAGSRLAASFSTAPAVVDAARSYIGWAILMPIVGVTSFVFDGVFIGSSWTRAMLVSMLAALAGFIGLLFATSAYGDNGLWLSFSLFFLLRAVAQAVLIPRLTDKSFSLVASSSLSSAT